MKTWVLPEYGARSIVEIPQFILEYFHVERHPLMENHTDSKTFADFNINKEKDHLILLIIDGLGNQLFKKMKEEGIIPFLSSFHSTYITSTFPSTTASALVSLSTGLTPSRHGILGFKMFLERPYTTMNTICYTIHGLDNARVPDKPESFMANYYTYESLARGGVKVKSFLKKEFVDSPFSTIVHGYFSNTPHLVEVDLFTQARKEILKARGRTFLSLYVHTLDSLSHTYGPYSDEVFEYMRSLDGMLAGIIAPVLDKTQILITADHGHVDTSFKDAVNLCDKKHIHKKIIGYPAGEPRAVYLRVKRKKDFIREVREEFGELLSVMEIDEVEKEGLWGGRLSESFRARVGDVVIIPEGRGFVLCGDEPESVINMRGRHGGLSIDEMLVPLIYN